jgi:hypothetical protein
MQDLAWDRADAKEMAKNANQIAQLAKKRTPSGHSNR